MLRVLGSDLPTCEDSRKRTIERLMMPSEPSRSVRRRSGDEKVRRRRNARPSLGGPGGRRTPGDPRDPRDGLLLRRRDPDDVRRVRAGRATTSTTRRLRRPRGSPAATTPARHPRGRTSSRIRSRIRSRKRRTRIARAREAAEASLLRRGGPRRGDRDTAESGWGEMLAGSPATPGETASTKKRLAFRTPEATTVQNAERRGVPSGQRTHTPSRRGGKSSRSPRASVYEARRRVSRHEAFAEEMCVLLLR